MAHILIIEDDIELGTLLERNLKLEGYRVNLLTDGRSGLNSVMSGAAQLIILDLMLPSIDGMHILKRMRQELINTPVVILTAKGTEAERLDGFRAGCDDYVTKPFSLMELIARIRAVLRRSGYREVPSVINSAGVIIDPYSRNVTMDGMNVVLSPREFDLLYILAARPNQVLSRSHLLDEVWGEEVDVTPRTVDSHISTLRQKIENSPNEPKYIVTVYKVGYKWNA